VRIRTTTTAGSVHRTLIFLGIDRSSVCVHRRGVFSLNPGIDGKCAVGAAIPGPISATAKAGATTEFQPPLTRGGVLIGARL
jgi:hypothetical protein